MTLEPLLAASLAIQIHAFAAMGAFAVGIVQLAGPKGTRLHRVLGWSWVLMMVTVAASGFWIHEIRLLGPWSPIHLLSVWVLAATPYAVWAARRKRIRAHRGTMIGLFAGALIVAGLFTFLPGRIMNQVLLGG